MGLLGVVYNSTIKGALVVGDRLAWLPVEVRAAIIGAGAGMLGWFMPGLIGSGEAIAQHALGGGGALGIIPLIFLFRLGFGAVSYASGAPGGLLAPMLVLGSQVGLFVGTITSLAFPRLGIQPVAFAVVVMAAFFTAVARTPLTSIILVTERWRDDRFFFFARVWRYPSSSCVVAHTAASI
jgi:CIC family chloride channel protein